MLFQKYPHPEYPQTYVYFRTQGDVHQHAKAVGDKKAELAEQEEVDLSKDSVLSRLNAQEDEKRAFLAQLKGQADGRGIPVDDQSHEQVAEKAAPAPVPALAPTPTGQSTTRNYLQNDIVEVINDSDPNMFGRILEATICRLGELRADGWDVFASLARDLDTHNGALERGLGSLVLASAILTGEDPQGQVIQRLRKRKPKDMPTTRRGFAVPKNDTGI